MNLIGHIFPDMPRNASAKDQLRAKMREKLRSLTPIQLTNQSAKIIDQLTFKPGESVALFANLPTEPRLLPLLDLFPTTHWFLPRVTEKSHMEFVRVTSSKNLRSGAFGILEPTGNEIAEGVSTFLCPGIAFTKLGDRLGQGGGFYDRYLKDHSQAQFIGIAFACQIVDAIPRKAHDIRMDRLVTS